MKWNISFPLDDDDPLADDDAKLGDELSNVWAELKLDPNEDDAVAELDANE